MDKNMINIDDLFKQRLSGGEEKERPGAWLQMRDLLDKEMPVSAGGTVTNWRRMFGYAAGLVLLASATIGGYNAYTSFRDAENEIIAPSTGSTFSGSSTTGNTKQTATYPGNKEVSVAGKTSTEFKGSPSGNNNTGKAVAINNSNSKTENSVTNSNKSNEKLAPQAVAKNNSKSIQPSGSTAAAVANGNISGKPATADKNAIVAKTSTNVNKNSVAKSDVTALNNNNLPVANSTASLNTQPSGSTSANERNNTVAANKVAAGNNTNVPEKQFASGNSSTNVNKNGTPNQPDLNKVATSTNTSGKNEVAKNDNVKKNLIDKVEERETYDRKTGAWKKDTIDKGKVEWTKEEDPMVAKVNKADNSTVNSAIVPAAAVAAKSENDAEKLVPLSDFRTSSKKSNYQGTNIFEEMVQNAKIQLGGVRFYPGLIVGINTALSGKNSMTGFQAGVTGTLSLNDKWGIVSELKYMQRFKNGNRESNRNDYITGEQPIAGGQYEWDSVVSYFTYPTVSSVELPVMIKYSLSRFNLLAGANLAYYMGFTPNHVEYKHHMTGMRPPVKPANGAILTSDDFGSRFGAGYLLGVGYQVSPALQLDMRMTQSVWDNAAGAGAEKVSKEVFQLPSLQFNMSYRFSSNKYKPYRSHQ